MLPDLCDRLIRGAVSEAVLSVVETLGPNTAAGADVARVARLLGERLAEAAQQLEFALRVIEVGASAPPAAPGSGAERPVTVEAGSSRRLPAFMERLLKNPGAPTLASQSAAALDEGTGDDANGNIVDALRSLLATLPDYRQLDRVADDLKPRYPLVQREPRKGTRANAVLHVFDKFGRTRALSLEDLVFALRTMNVFKNPDIPEPEARRIVGWEIRELRRRKWPIKSVPDEGFRLVEPEEMTV